MQAESGETYIQLLDVAPKNGLKLSAKQLMELQQHFSGKNLDHVKEQVMIVFRAQSEVTKKWAQAISAKTPFNREEQEQMQAMTRNTADKMVRVLNNLKELSDTLTFSPRRAEKSSSAESLSAPPRRNSNGALLVKSGSTNNLKSLNTRRRFGK